jgi:hypothetical protein
MEARHGIDLDLGPSEADEEDGDRSRRTGGEPWLTEARQALAKSLAAGIDLDQGWRPDEEDGRARPRRTRRTAATRTGTDYGGRGDLAAAVTSRGSVGAETLKPALIPC